MENTQIGFDREEVERLRRIENEWAQDLAEGRHPEATYSRIELTRFRRTIAKMEVLLLPEK